MSLTDDFRVIDEAYSLSRCYSCFPDLQGFFRLEANGYLAQGVCFVVQWRRKVYPITGDQCGSNLEYLFNRLSKDHHDDLGPIFKPLC